jgi:hypothetical protein
MIESSEDRPGKAKHIVRTLAICMAIALAAVAIIYLIHATEPTVKKSGATRKSAALVEVIYPKRGDYLPVITALGTVEPAREIQLSPRVSGQIISMTEDFIPGGARANCIRPRPSSNRNSDNNGQPNRSLPCWARKSKKPTGL